MKFHGASRSFGLAYECGAGSVTGVRKISLCVTLIEFYSAAAVRRVVIHELCHHFREEKRSPAARLASTSHDSVFCDYLSMADPLVDPTNSEHCTRFSEARDTAIVAAIGQRKASGANPLVWSPAAGELILDHYKATGRLRLEWRPNTAAGFRWKKEISGCNDTWLLEIAKRFPPSEWRSVRVVDARWREVRATDPTNLHELLNKLTRLYPNLTPETNKYLEDVGQKESP